MTVLAIITLGVSITFIGTKGLNDLTAQQIQATNAAREQMERMRARIKLAIGKDGIDEVADFYSRTANQTFTLDEIDGTGTIILYLDEEEVPVEIAGGTATYTDDGGHQFAPMDLDGDGSDNDLQSISGGRYSGTVLPVEVRVTWQIDESETKTQRQFLVVARTDDDD
jgi:hypothetical protein